MASLLKQLVSKVKSTSIGKESTQPELDSEPKEKLDEEEEDQDCLETLSALPQSPSPEAEYDKLLVSGKHTACFACSAFCVCLEQCLYTFIAVLLTAEPFTHTELYVYDGQLL